MNARALPRSINNHHPQPRYPFKADVVSKKYGLTSNRQGACSLQGIWRFQIQMRSKLSCSLQHRHAEQHFAQLRSGEKPAITGKNVALWELPWNRLQKPLACPDKSLKTLGGVLNPVSFSRQFPKSQECPGSHRASVLPYTPA